jgi:uncharacterized repeat protein (TIGR03833 family)
MRVGIVLKEDKKTGKITQGFVKGILTTLQFILREKVHLTNDQAGRIKEICLKVAEKIIFRKLV